MAWVWGDNYKRNLPSTASTCSPPRPCPSPCVGTCPQGLPQNAKQGVCWHTHEAEPSPSVWTTPSGWLPTLSLRGGNTSPAHSAFSAEHVKLKHTDFLIVNIADFKKKVTISCFEHFMFLTYLLSTLQFIWPDYNLHEFVQLLSENSSSSGHFSIFNDPIYHVCAKNTSIFIWSENLSKLREITGPYINIGNDFMTRAACKCVRKHSAYVHSRTLTTALT